MTSITQLKKNSQSMWDELSGKLKEETSVSYNTDERLWKPRVDKAGMGFARIRFLPPAEGESVAWVRYWDHFFQGPTSQWYVENSLTTFGRTHKDPCSEFNSRLWQQAEKERPDDENHPLKVQARDQKRRLKYVANVLIIKDSANPENDGKVMLYEFGKKIFDKINNTMNPDIPEGVTAEDMGVTNPFDFWNGCDFIIRIKPQGTGKNKYWNYDESSFDVANSGPIAKTDKEIEAIWKSQHSLEELVAPDKFKSYDELKERLDTVMGYDTSGNVKAASAPSEFETSETPSFETEDTSTPDEVAEEDYWKKLAEES